MRAIGDSRAGPLLWEGMDRVAAWLPGDYGARASTYVQRTRPLPPPAPAGGPAAGDLDPDAEPRLPEALPEELRPKPPGAGDEATTPLHVPEVPGIPEIPDIPEGPGGPGSVPESPHPDGGSASAGD